MGGFGIGGGGLDVQGIVSQLLFVERAPIRGIESRQGEIRTRISALNSFKTKLNELLSKLGTLNSPEKFASRTSTSSNESVLTASATSLANPGTHQITIERLALFDNFASDATFSDSNASIGTGSFVLGVGINSATITIDNTNNTLVGLKNAINNAGLDVNANIINDGSGHRITISSKDSGSENAIDISSNTLTTDGSTPFTFSRTHTIADTSELDASLTVNGLTVTSSSNKVTSVIQGVTIDLTGTSASTVTLTVANDTEAAKTAIDDFVSAYNDAYNFISSQFDFVESANSSGTLAGEGLVRRVQTSLTSIVTQTLPNLSSGTLNSLRAVGVELQGDGTLQVDSSNLNDALENNFEAIRDVFLASANTTNSNVVFLGVNSKTQEATFSVDITQLPERASVTSTNTIPGTLGVEETLTVTLNSSASVINLSSTDTLDDIVSKINAQLESDSIAASASKNGDNLVISSTTNGSAQSLTVVSDVDIVGTGFGTSGLSDTGQDVAGTFTNTQTSEVLAASGSGDNLLGSEGEAEGLSIQFVGSAIGSFGTIQTSLGFAERLEREAKGFTDLDSPLLERVDRLEQQVRDLDDDIRLLEDRLEIKERTLLIQFSRADQALRQLALLQTSLNSQFSQLSSLQISR